MAKQKRKLTADQRRAKKKKRAEREMVFINGKQVWVKRPPMIDGMSVDEFVMANADPIWLHQNGMWEYIQTEPEILDDKPTVDSDVPF